VRNDGTEPITVVRSIPGAREYSLPSPLEPGKIADVGFVGGPPDPRHDIIVKAFDQSGALVYCRRFTPREQQPPSSGNPISVKPGDLRCA
jgi:hypothetical protein